MRALNYLCWFSLVIVGQSQLFTKRVPKMKHLYFAYGSNLLKSRMLVQNPNAERAGIARLDNHRLDFKYASDRWGGHAATVVPDPENDVWGALWFVDDLESLDHQEGVHELIYTAQNVTLRKPDNSTVVGRTYKLVQQPEKGEENLPSRVYLEVILQGAKETGLPISYLEQLKKIKHDGFEGPVKVPGFTIDFIETVSK